MSETVVYKGWITVSPPRRKRDDTIIMAPNRFFYRPKKHVLAEKITTDIRRYGSYVNMRIWAYHAKIDQDQEYQIKSYMGKINSTYDEISGSDIGYSYTIQYIYLISGDDLLEFLARYHHHYMIIEMTYNRNEFDMISHELELILLRN